MRLILENNIPENGSINYHNPILCLGSCFAQRIGEHLEVSRFDCLVNPNGIVYNPLSIAMMLERGLSTDFYKRDELANYKELWFSWQHHGQFSSVLIDQTLATINEMQTRLHDKLNQTNLTVLITLGSAWVYERDGTIVANCHKAPANEFTKRLLDVDEIVDRFGLLFGKMQHVNVIFTVSPVRYVRDGLHQSTLSKSVLHLAVDKLCKTYTNASYFSAYEIVIDELRDYRFYDEDLVHPNSIAVDYVWNKFQQSQFDLETKTMVHDWQKLSQMLNHKLLHAETEDSKRFIEKRNVSLTKFNKTYF